MRLSIKGEKMTCTIWSGYMPGIYIGAPKRRKHFSKDTKEIIIEIESQDCFSTLTPSFWSQCPEIRVARSRTGFNVLLNWIRKHGLQPPKRSREEKGKKVTVTLEVIEPYKKFKLTLRARVNTKWGTNNVYLCRFMSR